MPSPTLLCSRPHPKDVDFAHARFIVSTGAGLKIDDKRLVMGDLVPEGSLSADALRQEYDATKRIETLDHALEMPYLALAMRERGVTVEKVSEPKPEVFVPDLNELSLAELVDLCAEQGLGTGGNRKQLIARLRQSCGKP